MSANRTVFVTVCALALLLLTACDAFVLAGVRGSGPVLRQERSVSGIDSVDLGNQGDLEIEIGDEERLVVEAEESLLPHIETEVRGGTLRIRTRDARGGLRNRKPIRYFLTVRSLEALRASSAGDIRAPALSADRFEIVASSAGDVEIARLEARTLDVEVSSAGDVSIGGGRVDEQAVRLSSAGDYDAPRLVSRTADVRVSSAGDATVHVTERLEARLSSAGDVYLYGDPAIQERSSSVGEVIRRD
ncbi:MAG: head GIN domain-containing protein [Thermoanaerobaculia bacterium]|nr:head GIN domain-containing protein [Thermoanaerobaculia bacterium]